MGSARSHKRGQTVETPEEFLAVVRALAKRHAQEDHAKSEQSLDNTRASQHENSSLH